MPVLASFLLAHYCRRMAADGAPAAIVSAFQLTPDILVAHEVRFISSSSIYHQAELSLFFFLSKAAP